MASWEGLHLQRCVAGWKATDVADSDLDTNGIAYDEVTSIKHYEMDAYVCPKLSAEVVEAAQAQLAHFEAMTGMHAEVRAQQEQGQKGESCFDRVISSIDDLLANAFD